MTVHEAAAALRDADEARRDLRAALEEKGLTLPGLSVDEASSAGLAPRPLVELGRVNVATARKLVAVLRASTYHPGTGPGQ